MDFPILNDVNDLDIDAELAKFEAEERKRLGLEEQVRQSWTDSMSRPWFGADERPKVTILVSGLTMAHDLFVEAVLKGLGYNITHLDCPDNEALRYGKEFGNRAQCNPTYFTVGNLLKHLDLLRKQGLSEQEIIDRYIFLTAGACGPCRFGMYVTEYRKALRDAGFDGFRVLLFQQTGGFRQATGKEVGLKMDAPFFLGLAKAIIAGDVLNAITYRIRPYEVEPGATDRAVAECKRVIYDALANRKNILAALWRCRKILGRVKVDKTVCKPKVSIIGEFWAMTTEGDGNYQLQRFVESEGGECDIQLVTAWLLYMLWEGRYDTTLRRELKATDKGRKGLEGVNVAKKLAVLHAADYVVRAVFQAFAHAIGLYHYHLPDLDEVNAHAAPHYNTLVRGGESYMEVGKLIVNAIHKKANMTISVKPFGCMPSSGVSDGVQTIVTEKYPGTIFCAVETSGDGRVNCYSRIQMFLFKAKLQAKEEVDKALADTGVTLDEVRAFLEKHRRYAHAFHKAPHVVACTAADLIYEVAPLIRKSRLERAADRTRALYRLAKVEWEKMPARWDRARDIARKAPGVLRQARAEWKEASPALKQWAIEELKKRFLKTLVVATDEAPTATAEPTPGTTRVAA